MKETSKNNGNTNVLFKVYKKGFMRVVM